jgi:DnaJ-class molecular chaperone
MEIILSPEEARQGGIYPVKVPVWQSCPDCRHADRWETLYCPTCRGAGAIHSFREFDLTIPPNIQHGLTADVTMEGIGLHGVRLTVDVQVR